MVPLHGLTASHLALLALASLIFACKPAPPPADPVFSDAARFTFREFDTEQPADLAFAIRALERTLYLGFDLGAESARERSSTPEFLREEDVAGIDSPGLPLGDALPVSVSRISHFPLSEHQAIPLLVDQTPLEPQSDDHYDRTFFEDSERCWPSRDCEYLRTLNNLTKENALLTVTYDLYKDFRWVDLNLPDPSTVPEGEEAINDGPKRWAYAARAWTTEIFPGAEGQTSIDQSFTVEVWLPRDGGGFLRDGSETNAIPEGGEQPGSWDFDSEGGGVLRMLALWSQTTLGVAIEDYIVQNTIANGIDGIFETTDAWLEEQR